MPAPDLIIVPQLARLVGLPDAPLLLDVRTEEDFAAEMHNWPTPSADSRRVRVASS